jgi:hypothetical protein
MVSCGGLSGVVGDTRIEVWTRHVQRASGLLVDALGSAERTRVAASGQPLFMLATVHHTQVEN